ncbi:phenylalanine--tRNA ligase subunit alpha [Spiroplasma endosymbiont of Amphibalanus improvisus]|uniref:phenylalanine--tRNA ligase subunit alpha n=1 Tax=Spiroplasma endosymbiont of Amphibalanus improvisus TaxID=3066327 RepID=UPI003CC7A14C
MESEIKNLFLKVKKEINNIDSIKDLTNYQSKILGKNSEITKLLRSIKDLKPEEMRKTGFLINDYKKKIADLFKAEKITIEEKQINKELLNSRIDVTFDPDDVQTGFVNPLFIVQDEIISFFNNLGYQTVNGNEVETDEYNFQRLNLTKDHPARDMQDSFFLDSKTVLRTHCTNMTARAISQVKDLTKPIAQVSIGNVYRRDDDDSTHSHQFIQLDGFLIAKNITFANLKWTLQEFCKHVFGDGTTIRMRPSYFPFTEPSVEVDISCVKCNKKGCSLCKQTGFIEILGAGMISPGVFEKCGKSKDLQGFAFGVGIERIAMLKYGVENIRDFYNNDMRFLQQFRTFK